MASLSLAALLVFLASSGLISSSPSPGSFRGYQTSFASSQAQSYDPRRGVAYNTVKVTSPQCSVIKRSTRYEKVRVPFLCQVMTGRVMPMPRDINSGKAQVLAAMKAGGWAVCYKAMVIPVHRFQRLPACCPGTLPTPNGGCVCKKSLAAHQAAVNRMPSPGELLQNLLQQAMQESRAMLYPAYQYRAAPSLRPVQAPRPPMIRHSARPYRVVLNRGPSMAAMPGPGPLMQQVMFQRSRGGPSYTTDQRGPALLKQLAVKSLINPNQPTARRPPQSPLSDWHNDVARYLAAMMYQKMLVEQQQQKLQDELERQTKLRKQLEMWANQQRLLLQQRLQQLQGGRQPTSSPISPNADPSPIPPPPVNRVQTTPFSKQPTQAAGPGQNTDGSATAGTGHSQTGQAGQAGQDGQPQKDQGAWTGSEGILDRMPLLGQPVPPAGRSPMFGNGAAANMPPANLRNAMLEMRDKVKKIVDDCMEKSGITNPMEDVVRTGDVTKLRPVCRASETVGPCVMEESSKSLGRDQVGMFGRQMMQSVLMSLGQMCMRLNKADQMMPGPKMTSPPVFPNPAPSMTKAAVTEGTPVEKTDADSPTGPQTSNIQDDEPVKQFAKPIEEPPALTPSPHVQEEEVEVAEAAFPMWMILTMVGACAALLLFCCLTVCLVLRCRRKKKSVELDREPEKLPVPAQANIYAASPCVPPPAYATTAVKQTLGGEEEEELDDKNFKIPEDDVKVTDEEEGKEKEEEKEKKEEKAVEK